MAQSKVLPSGSGKTNGFAGAKKERRGKRAELPEDLAKKLKSCSVLGCEEWRDLSSHTTYHCFPTGDKNQQRWEIWTHLLQKARDDASWIPFRGSLVCSHHFRQQDFILDPNQKRTKLLKNSIPSIFPTFQVDLDDPNFNLDESGDDNQNGYDYDFDSVEDLNSSTHHNGYEYHDQEQQQQDIDEQSEVQYEDDEDIDVEDLQYVHRPLSKSSKSHIRPLPKLTQGTSIQHRRSNEMVTIQPVVEPPRKKVAVAANNNFAMAQQRREFPVPNNKVINKSQAPYRSSEPSSNGRGMPNLNNQSKLYKQLCQSTNANSSAKLPFSWNPDLEIEVIGNSENDRDEEDSYWKQRVEELEREKEILRQKYEAQIRTLQRRVKEQGRTINQYELHFQTLQEQE